MIKMKSNLHLTLVAVILLFSMQANAQVAKGFKMIEQEQYNEALLIFQKALSEPKDRVAAQFGIASIYQKSATSASEFAEALSSLSTALNEFKTMSNDDKSRVAKLGVTLINFESLNKSIQTGALEFVAINENLLQLDTIMEVLNPVSPMIKAKLDALRKQIILDISENPDDYDYFTLTSLVRKHYQFVTANNFKGALTVKQKLLSAFFKEGFGYDSLNQFVTDHPDRWPKNDCWLQEFIQANKPYTNLKAIQFIMKYPYSSLATWSDRSLSYNTKGIPISTLSRQFSSNEMAQFKILQEGWKLDSIIKSPRTKFSDEIMQRIARYVEKRKGQMGPYYMVKTTLDVLLKSKEWNFANKLLNITQPLMPDFIPEGCETQFFEYTGKQGWFAQVKPIVEREAEGIDKKMLSSINAAGDVFSPVPTADGRSIYFAVRKKTSSGGEDIFVSHYDFNTDKWSAPQSVTSLCTAADESPVAISYDGNEMLLFREGKLYSSKLTLNGWDKPKQLPSAINNFEWMGEASFSSDGKVVIFAASESLPDLFHDSNKDIFICRRDDSGNWGAPSPLSIDVNTFEDDRSPFLYPDDKTLYFSSSGHGGLGDMDVFYTTRLDDTWQNWSVPKNLGKEVNTMSDDWGYTLSLNPKSWDAYTVSSGLYSNKNDIYVLQVPSFARPVKIIPFSGKVVGHIGSVAVVVTDPATGKALDTVKTRPDGSFTLLIPVTMKKIDYHVLGEKLFPNTRSAFLDEVLKNPAFTDKAEVITLDDMLKGNKIATLNDINFDFGKSVIKEESFLNLERVYTFFQNNTWAIEISGHTDNKGTPEYNKKLSRERAEAVKKFLVNKGITESRIKTQGLGAEKPVAENETEEGRALNRRVEFRIVQ